MKKLTVIGAFLCMMIMLSVTSASASAARVKKSKSGSITKFYLDKAEIMETRKLASSGTKTDGGYYLVEFAIPGTKQICHLTGLTEKNISEVQNELIKCYKEGGDFSIENIDFIDTEKTHIEGEGDSELCWAGTASNMLHYAGWGRLNGHDCDDIFDLFSKNFVNEGGYMSCAFGWYFNGVGFGIDSFIRAFRMQDEDTPTDPLAPNGGRFLPQYAFEAVTDEFSLDNMPGDNNSRCLEMMKRMEAGFAKGDAVGISVFNTNGGGHAITLFGYVTDDTYKTSNLKHYPALIVADSDNDKDNAEDRRSFPNKYTLLRTKPEKHLTTELKTLSLVDYGFQLGGMTILKTPGQAVEEKDSTATKNKRTTVDLTPKEIFFGNGIPDSISGLKACAGEDIYAKVYLLNASYESYKGECPVRLTVKNSAGETIQTLDQNVKFEGDNQISEGCNVTKPLSPLEVGTYQVVLEINPEHKLKEAYYTNNTYTSELKVVKRSIDVSGISISAKVDDFKKSDSSTAHFTYKGEDKMKKNGWSVVASLAFFDDNSVPEIWGEYGNSETDSKGAVGNYSSFKGASNVTYNNLPKTTTIYNHGPKIMFRLEISNGSEPPAYVYSPAYNLKYRKLEVETISSNTTKMKRGATGLNAGEEITFCIKNTSTYDSGVVSGKYTISTFVDGDVVLDSGEISLGYGEKTQPIKFKSWGKPLYGTHFIDVNLGWDGRDPSHSGDIGKIIIEEEDKTEVTIPGDIVDPYDESVSLREAIDYAEKNGKTITFEYSIRADELVLDRPIEIKGKVSINGYFTVKKKPFIQCVASSVDKKPVFIIDENAQATIKGLSFVGTTGRKCSTIENRGGKLTLRQCHLDTSKSVGDDGKGGAIYSKGGKLLMEKCRVQGCEAKKGGAICLDGTQAEILNSFFVYNHAAEGGSIYTKGAPCNIVASTFATGELTDTDIPDSIVNGDKDTSIILCAFGANGDSADVGGEAKVYASYLKKAGENVTVDNRSVFGPTMELFYSYSNTDILYGDFSNYGSVADDYKYESIFLNGPQMRKRKGYYIRKESDGTIGISSNGKTYKSTGVKALFGEGSYTVDLFSKARTYQFGCLAQYYRQPAASEIGKATMNLTATVKKGLPTETTLGRIFAHALRRETKADVCMVANGNIKGTIKKGKTTVSQCIKTLFDPDQMIEVKQMTGADLKSMLEDSIDRFINAQKKKKNDTLVLQLSGVEVRYNAKAAKGKRIKSVKVKSKALNVNKYYKVGMLASSGVVNAYTVWKNAKHLSYVTNGIEAYMNTMYKSASFIKSKATKTHYIAVK